MMINNQQTPNMSYHIREMDVSDLRNLAEFLHLNRSKKSILTQSILKSLKRFSVQKSFVTLGLESQHLDTRQVVRRT